MPQCGRGSPYAHARMSKSLRRSRYTAVFGTLAILCGRQTKCAHAQKFKSYAAPLNFSVALSTVGDFNFAIARLTKTAVLVQVAKYTN